MHLFSDTCACKRALGVAKTNGIECFSIKSSGVLLSMISVFSFSAS